MNNGIESCSVNKLACWLLSDDCPDRIRWKNRVNDRKSAFRYAKNSIKRINKSKHLKHEDIKA